MNDSCPGSGRSSDEPAAGVPQEERAGAPPGPPRRVLIVDDSPSVRAALRETLRAMPAVGEVIEAVDGLDALALLARQSVDLVISDVTMPRLDGFKLLAALRQNPRFREVMVIMLSALGESVDKVRGLTIGANDYVTKPFEKGELQARVAVMLKMRELQEELRCKNLALERANEQLERLANLDVLTGLPNRRFLFDRFASEYHRARRLELPLSCLMIDIDHFKAFNDRHGHQAGDEALRAVGAAIHRGIRAYDLAGRYGGEEFIAILPETVGRDALAVAERLRAAIEAAQIEIGADAPAGHVTVSVGIAACPDIVAERLEDLVDAADRALYEAKRAGRNRCQLCTR